MAVTTRFDPEIGARVHRVNGPVHFPDIRRALKEVYEAEDYDPETPVLWDLREADATPFSADDVRRLSEFVAQYRRSPAHSRAALLVSRDVDFGLARMYEQVHEIRATGEVAVFRDYDEAVAWLTR